MDQPVIAGSVELCLCAGDALRRDVESLCAAARQRQCLAVCVNTSRVQLAAALLEDSDVLVVGLVGFPLGAADADAKRYETELAVDLGAQEIDYVVNLGRLKEGDHRFVLREMRDIVEAADERVVKAIVEASLLTREEIIQVCKLALDAGVKFVSTGTDTHQPPLQVADLEPFLETLGGSVGVKAVGGIRDTAMAQAFLAAGASRIGMCANAGF